MEPLAKRGSSEYRDGFIAKRISSRRTVIMKNAGRWCNAVSTVSAWRRFVFLVYFQRHGVVLPVLPDSGDIFDSKSSDAALVFAGTGGFIVDLFSPEFPSSRLP